MKTVVSLTPLPLDRDSRTLKIATSLAQLGYRSIVVENRPSAAGRDTGPVEVVTLGRRAANPAVAPPSADPGGDSVTARLRGWSARRVPRAVREPVHFLVFLTAYMVWRPLLALWQVPPADLYYLHEYRLFPSLWLLRRVRGRVPIIYDAHDIYAEVWDRTQLSWFWRRVFVPTLFRLERWCAAHADAVVTVGDGVARRIGALLDVTPWVLRNAHDSRLERTPPRDLRHRLGLGSATRLVVVVGNRKPGQAVAPIVAALATLPTEVHLAFVGRHYDDVPGLAAAAGVAERVHTPGALPPEHLVPAIRSADAAALLYYPHSDNTRYILPNGFFQSLSARLPLLWPCLPELESIVGDRQVGATIDPCDADSVAAGLHAVLGLDDTDRAAMVGELDRLAHSVSWEAEEGRLATLVEHVLSPHSDAKPS
jgi:glycosyltransferase involved in cell wall biosynthesis